MRQDRKERRSLICVVSPTFAGCAPQLKEVAKPRARDERQHSKAMIGWREDQQDTQRQREPGIGLIECRGNKDQHQDQEGSECDPIKGKE